MQRIADRPASNGRRAILATVFSFTAMSLIAVGVAPAGPRAASPAVPSAIGADEDHWCVQRFKNRFHLPIDGCTGHTLTFSAVGRSKTCPGPCEYYMKAESTNDVTGGVADFEESEGTIDCGGAPVTIEIQCTSGLEGPCWYEMEAECSECTRIDDYFEPL